MGSKLFGINSNRGESDVPNRPKDFRHYDVVRALKAAQAAGLPNPSVRIRGPSGTEYYVSGGEVVAGGDMAKKQGRDAPLAKVAARSADPPAAGRTTTKKKAPVGGTANRARPA
jgi:hypothetical protein